MRQTPNRGYNVPDEDETGWADEMDDTFDGIDQDVQTALDSTGDGAVVHTGYTMVDVPGDYSTIQEAVDESVPFLSSGGAVQIDIAPGTYDEDVYIGPYITGSSDGGNLRLEGDRNAPADYEINSMCVHGCRGINAPEIRGVTFTGENTTISSGMAIGFFACQNSKIDTVRFEPDSGSVEEGVSGYGGTQLQVANIDVTNTDFGVVAKGQSTVDVTGATGQANQYPYWATETGQIGWRFGDATAGSTSSYFDLVQLDNGSLGFPRNGTRMKNLVVGGTFEATSSKDWIHPLDDGREIVYSAQESDAVRAAYEGQATLSEGETTVELPAHFDEVTSTSEPLIRAQVTPNALATVAVTERSTSELTVEADTDVEVDYRVTAVRDGFEDKETYRYPDDWDGETEQDN